MALPSKHTTDEVIHSPSRLTDTSGLPLPPTIATAEYAEPESAPTTRPMQPLPHSFAKFGPTQHRTLDEFRFLGQTKIWASSVRTIVKSGRDTQGRTGKCELIISPRGATSADSEKMELSQEGLSTYEICALLQVMTGSTLLRAPRGALSRSVPWPRARRSGSWRPFTPAISGTSVATSWENSSNLMLIAAERRPWGM